MEEYKSKNFVTMAVEEYNKLDPNGKVFIIVGSKRDIRRSVSNDYIEITVLKEEEKQFMEGIFSRAKQSNNRLSGTINNLNSKEISTREAIKKVKKSNNKKTMKKGKVSAKKKKYTITSKIKGEIKEFLKKNGLKIGVGITALAVMGTITSETLKNRADNINRYNQEFTSIEQVEEKIKGIIDAEIKEAVYESNLEKDSDKGITVEIERIEAYREETNDGVEIIITGVNDSAGKMVLHKEKWKSGNMPKSLEEMAECYLDVCKIPNDSTSDGNKNIVIKKLKKVEEIASQKDFEIEKKSSFQELFGRNEHKFKEIKEREADDGFDR